MTLQPYFLLVPVIDIIGQTEELLDAYLCSYYNLVQDHLREGHLIGTERSGFKFL
ncbi:hypothetical protein FACS189485_20960 [Spirochaetia bacterium]|nr:hypothetical protein FACS1894106_3560 [Spirochaetia bacterium]GHV08928.1 hypothetical protein FACS189485_20960 [Spirochaetia bacterium]